jgi:hypothetical protein
MKRLIPGLVLALLCAGTGWGQQSSADAPATKEDVQRYLDVIHSREMMTQIVDAMIKPMHQMIHEQFMKDKDKLPPDFEARMTKLMDDSMKSFPWDEMMQAMVPVYQKHFTKGDIDAIVAFYSAPSGQKMLKEMPAMMSEATQSMMPIIRKQMGAMTERIQQEVAEMLSAPKPKPSQKPQATPN